VPKHLKSSATSDAGRGGEELSSDISSFFVESNRRYVRRRKKLIPLKQHQVDVVNILPATKTVV
jgi:hypothetical protein